MITAKDLPCWVTSEEVGSPIAWATAIDLGDDTAMLLFPQGSVYPVWLSHEGLKIAESPPPDIDPDVYDKWAEQLPALTLPPRPERKIKRGDLVSPTGWGDTDSTFTVVSMRDDGLATIDCADDSAFVFACCELTYVGPGDPAVLARWSL